MIEIECVVTEIPESFEIDVREMEIGDSIHAGDVKLAPGAKLISEPDMLICNCHVVTEAPTTEEVEEEMPTAPERIGEKPEAEEGEDSGGEENE